MTRLTSHAPVLLSLGFTVALPFAVWVAFGAEQRVGGSSPASASAENVKPFFKQHCFACHSGKTPDADIKLDALLESRPDARSIATWRQVLQVLRRHEMPPEGNPRPAEADSQATVAWIDGLLKSHGKAGGDKNTTQSRAPSSVTLRRLNRTEYANTVHDLTGVRFDREQLPADDVGYGFDNIGDVLSLSPLLMEKYLAAAEQIVREVSGSAELAARVFFVKPGEKAGEDEATRRILDRFAQRAWRRPVTGEELARLAQLAGAARKAGDGFEDSVQLALQAVLVSPNFLFHLEGSRPGDSLRPVDLYVLASRLSYFLWSTMPDDELFVQAAQGTLPVNLEQQVRRMLKDPKAAALVENFAGQWLQLRNLASARPDQRTFPDFDNELREAMLTETQMLVRHVIAEDRPVLDLLDADYTFVNERLAKHYGIAAVSGNAFRRVPLAGTPRGGVMTHASILTITSNPTRTSPVKRGKWIMENLLNEPPRDPPPNVPQLPEDSQAVLSGSLRQRFEQHRRDPVCASCHRKMDAYGFAMENFDPIGRWRTRDGKFDVDPSGTLPDGQSFAGPAELRAIISKTNKEQFVGCVAEKMFIYALGRGVEPADQPTLERIVQGLPDKHYKFSSLVLEIVSTDAFQGKSESTLVKHPVKAPP